MSTNNRELFSEWLKSKSVSKPPINLILLAFDEVSEFAVSRKLSKVCIWAISSQSDFKFVRVAISKIKYLELFTDKQLLCLKSHGNTMILFWLVKREWKK